MRFFCYGKGIVDSGVRGRGSGARWCKVAAPNARLPLLTCQSKGSLWNLENGWLMRSSNRKLGWRSPREHVPIAAEEKQIPHRTTTALTACFTTQKHRQFSILKGNTESHWGYLQMRQYSSTLCHNNILCEFLPRECSAIQPGLLTKLSPRLVSWLHNLGERGLLHPPKIYGWFSVLTTPPKEI